MSHTYSIGSASSIGQASSIGSASSIGRAGSRSPATGRAGAVGRPYRTIVVSLMLVTSSIAVLDLYLFASSGFH